MSVELCLNHQDLMESDKNDNSSLAKVPLENVVYQKVSNIVPLLDDRLPGNLYQTVISSVERPLILSVLEHTSGNQCKAAQMLGINRNTLRKKISQLGIETKSSPRMK